MSGTLYYILMKAFKNSKVREKACHSSKNILTKHSELTNRIFDHFPCLITEKQLSNKIEQLKEIISNIEESSVSDKMILTDEVAKTKITLFEKAIAKMAVDELLTYEEKLKPEIIKLLDWEEFEKELNKPTTIYNILCAYVGGVNQVLIEHFGKKPEKSNEVYAAFCHHINKNSHDWILDKLDPEGDIVKCYREGNLNKKWNYEKILKWPIEPPQPGVLVVLTAVAAAAAYLFFKKSPEEKPNETPEIETSLRI